MPRKEKFMGMDIEVLSEAELLRARTATVKMTQACMRVVDAPNAPTISARHAAERQQLPCEECDALCWFDPKSGPGRLFVRLICIPCLLAEAKAREKR